MAISFGVNKNLAKSAIDCFSVDPLRIYTDKNGVPFKFFETDKYKYMEAVGGVLRNIDMPDMHSDSDLLEFVIAEAKKNGLSNIEIEEASRSSKECMRQFLIEIEWRSL